MKSDPSKEMREIIICANMRNDRFKKKLNNRIDKQVDLWHESIGNVPLHQWLGWTKDEYAGWVQSGLAPRWEYSKDIKDLG